MNPNLNRFIDASVLRPDLTRNEALTAMKFCLQHEPRALCVRPCDLEFAGEVCRGTSTDLCTVLGFPHGNQLPASKADEAKRYVECGVAEIDMVANYGLARSGLFDLVLADIEAVVAVTRPASVALKVIFETDQLDLPTIRRMTELSVHAGADWVKTSTGFNGAGATDEVVRAMLESAAGRIKVKASGGVRSRMRAEHLISLGVERLGVNVASLGAVCADEPLSAAATGY
jgi:deoxyribose-phosphate aldolase